MFLHVSVSVLFVFSENDLQVNLSGGVTHQQGRGYYLYSVSELITDEQTLVDIGTELDVRPEDISRYLEDNSRDIHIAALIMLQSWSDSIVDDSIFKERLHSAFQNNGMGNALDIQESRM